MIKLYRSFGFNIQMILITTLLSNVGIFMVIPFLAIYLNEINSITTVDIGIILGVAFWCQRAGSLIGGVLSDYLSIKKTLLFGLIIRIPGYLALGFVTDFYLLILACSLIGLGSSIYLPAAKSYLVKNTEDTQRIEALSTRVVFSNIGVAIGPVIGLLVFEIYPALLFIIVSIVFLFLFLLNYLIKNTTEKNIVNTLNFNDFTKLIVNPKMVVVALSMFVFTALYMQIEITIPLLAKDLFTKPIVSGVFIINAAVVIFFQVYISKWACDINNRLPIVLGYLLFSISFIILEFSEYSYFLIYLAVIIFTFSEIIFQIRLDFEVTEINNEMVASSFGIMSLTGAFGGLLGSYLGASFYSELTAKFSLWELLSVFCLFLSAISLLPKYKKGVHNEKSFSNDKSS